jgi:hypothetical protein
VTLTSTPAQTAGWREEARRDRMARAQIGMERDAARAELRIAERRALAEARRDDAHARAAARERSRKARAARRRERLAWLAAHTTDLLFVPVIVVPAVLAWTAMAAYGSALYGPAGLALPAFSEGAMWAFAAATTVRERDNRRRAERGEPPRPVWHLRAGTALFAAVGAALNFAHGITAARGPRGPVTGTVYAVVSVAGVSVHQIVTAGPRRPGAEQDAARLARIAARRERAARRAAVRAAVIHIDQDGAARLACQPGPAVLTRRRGRTRLEAAPGFARLPVPLMATGPACPLPGTAAPAPKSAPAGAPAPARTRTRRKQVHRTSGAVRGAVDDQAAEVHFAAELAAGRVPSARQIKKELHVGQDRAAQIRAHLGTVANPARVTA